MDYSYHISPYRLIFKKPAGTSRGVYHKRDVWYIYLTSDKYPGRVGIGECAPLPNLSCDDVPEYEDLLHAYCEKFCETGQIDYKELMQFPSILFGIETALTHLETGSLAFYNTPFAHSEAGIPINGLIWMGDYQSMYQQIESKLAEGFHCIKLKIGAIDFAEELELIRLIRERYTEKDIEIRLDANGAFPTDSALHRLNELAKYDIHSIEQPIAAGQWSQMAALVKNSPIPIALDEELIGITHLPDKKHLLDEIHPHYIILKPSLHGGISGSDEWIKLADERDIKWWITSALESNIGLNAIAQYCASLNNALPQGLGTGALYINNIESPLYMSHSSLWFDTRR